MKFSGPKTAQYIIKVYENNRDNDKRTVGLHLQA